MKLNLRIAAFVVANSCIAVFAAAAVYAVWRQEWPAEGKVMATCAVAFVFTNVMASIFDGADE